MEISMQYELSEKLKKASEKSGLSRGTIINLAFYEGLRSLSLGYIPEMCIRDRYKGLPHPFRHTSPASGYSRKALFCLQAGAPYGNLQKSLPHSSGLWYCHMRRCGHDTAHLCSGIQKRHRFCLCPVSYTHLLCGNLTVEMISHPDVDAERYGRCDEPQGTEKTEKAQKSNHCLSCGRADPGGHSFWVCFCHPQHFRRGPGRKRRRAGRGRRDGRSGRADRGDSI